LRPRNTYSTFADVTRVVGRMRVSREVASFATYLHAALAQGVELRAAGNELRAAGNEVDLTPCTGERSTDVGAARAGSEHCDSHGSRPFHREIRVQYVACNIQS